jgi:hypothetical protein
MKRDALLSTVDHRSEELRRRWHQTDTLDQALLGRSRILHAKLAF